MNIDRLLSKRVTKLTVKDLKEALKNADDDAEIILCFNWKDGEDKVVYGYLAEILHLKYDGVLKERLETANIVELDCYNDDYCTYREKR